MKKTKKIIASFITAISLLALTPVAAHAEWKFTSQGWEYLENGSQKTRWIQDSGNWYYLGYDGIMKTGWVNDEGTWYYLTDKGTWNDSKTTKTMPSEVKNIYDIIKFYKPNGKFYYNGLTEITSGLLYKVGFQNVKLYRFIEMDDHANTINEYYYSPYDGCAYELTQTEVVRLGIGDKTTSNNSISKEQAIQNVKNYVNDNHKNMPLNFEVIQDLNEKNTNTYEIHFYNDAAKEDLKRATATNGWYYVDKKYGNVISMYDI